MSSRTPGIIGLVIATAIWGSTFLVTKDTLDTLSAANFLLWRFGIAAIVLLAASPEPLAETDKRRMAQGPDPRAVSWRRLPRPDPRTAAHIGGGVRLRYRPDGGADAACRRSAVPRAGPGARLGSSHRGYGRPGADLAARLSTSPGVGLTILGAALFALQIASLSQWATKENSYGLTTISVAVTAVMCLLAATLTGGVTVPSSGPDWTAILYLALGATCFGLVLQAWSQSHLSATTAAVIMTLEPAWAGAIAVVIGGEVLTLRMWIGAALILVAMFIAEFGPRGKRDTELQWVSNRSDGVSTLGCGLALGRRGFRPDAVACFPDSSTQIAPSRALGPFPRPVNVADLSGQAKLSALTLHSSRSVAGAAQQEPLGRTFRRLPS